MKKTYRDMLTFDVFEDRIEYLMLHGRVGEDTFGYDRWLNQLLYHDREWRRFRDEIIIRDNGCDLACEGYDIIDRIYVHHINPISLKDIEDRDPMIFDPNNVVCCSYNTHQMIHYGVKPPIRRVERQPGDTCPWR